MNAEKMIKAVLSALEDVVNTEGSHEGHGCHSDKSKKEARPLRSMKATPAVARMDKETEKELAASRIEARKALDVLKAAIKLQDVSHQKLWATIGTEMGLWESPEGENMHYNSETNEVEFYALDAEDNG